MTCDRRAHPYLDVSGNRKYAGITLGGESSCALVNVNSNVLSVPIEVSEPDDLGRQDGETGFCRSYSSTCPVLVAFTAPPFAGASGDKEFREWQVNGVAQPAGEMSVVIDPCSGECFELRAAYGAVFSPIPCDFCIGPDGALQLPETIIVRSPINVIGGQCWQDGPCGYLPFNNTPPSCWGQLWESGSGSDFECNYSGTGAPPSNICGATWTSNRILHPNPDPSQPEDRCWPEYGCNTPAVDCFYSPLCYICQHHPRQRMKTWLMSESALANIFIWNPPAQPDFVFMTWFAATRKTFCMQTDRDEDTACQSYCQQQGSCYCQTYRCGSYPAAPLIAPGSGTGPGSATAIQTQAPFSSDWQGIHPDAPLLTERISNHGSCMAAAQHLINTGIFHWSGSVVSSSHSRTGHQLCNFGWHCEPIDIALDFTLNF